MNVLIDLCIVPIGVGVSVSAHVAKCQETLQAAGLAPRLHPFGTAVEGEWETVMNAVRDCFEAMHDMGAPRVHATMRMGTRIDREQTLADKVDSVNARTT
ncbi:MAG: thiamine-binding protein [Proteobacteria bacterium]|nr:MAG: thiamine-binding protein [Pseudomonadota bacterium]